jgi:hypothetical protein
MQSVPINIKYYELIPVTENINFMQETRNVCITKYARLYKLSNGMLVIQSNN